MRLTSLAAWDAYARQLPRARSEALKAVVDCVGSTARELERITGDRKINARLSELEAHGLIEARSERRCTVTGHTALTWWPRESPVFRPLPPRASRAAALRKDRLDIEAEREACAALAECCAGTLHTSGGCCGARIAALIRARGAR